ncbi:DUF4153 domain-containing protein [Hymenobacter sp. BT491]|uniref:DUF4153 domain-containing protein n=1 Tax=Hymenobacter sp. BT491 TaxID=2766779 RepID=UPI001653A209|nr:DUF4153 domain-containing protein [Hymenobacter sp. BT491]MBC6990630.1 DUF4173 domain-containing protein [Hymenobacter sp. BT491]
MNTDIRLPITLERTTQRAVTPRISLTKLQKLLLPIGAIAFDVLFWEHAAGLNLALYTLFVVGGVLAGQPLHAAVWRSGYFWFALSGTVLSAVMVVLYASGAAQLACVASLVILLGYVNQPHLKLVVYALFTAIANLGHAVPGVLSYLRPPQNVGSKAARTWFYGRLLVLPMLVLGLFHVLFSLANPKYNALSARALQMLSDWLSEIFVHISVPELLFCLLGLVLTAGALVVVPVHLFADHESRFGEFVRRQRNRVASFAVRQPDFRTCSFRALDLRKEYLMALAVLALVNGLLLVVNAIDINWIWFGFQPAPGFDLTQFVHEGTYVLILSILVAMAIVLWFFRRNLNFYQPGLRTLRIGATIWVVQNAVLAISVGLRNYYYILHTGLAYKRIGVYGFLLDMPGRVLPEVVERRAVLNEVPKLTFEDGYNGFIPLGPQQAQTRLDATVAEWVRHYEAHRLHDWQSWNYADYQAYQQLKRR